MNSGRIAAALPSLVVAIVAAVYVWMSYDYAPASRSLPWIAGVLVMALALIDVASKGGNAARGALRSLPGEHYEARDAAERSAVPHSPSQEAIAFAWIGAFLPLVVVLGFYAAILLYVFCYLRLYASKGALASVGAALGVAGFLYLVFEVLMGYAVFGGLLAGDAL